MPQSSLTIEQILALLAAAPARIATLTEGLTAAQLSRPPSQGEWSANEVLAHLRSCADVWGGCIERILAAEMPTIKAMNPTTWIKNTDYPEQEFPPSFQAFAAQRTQLLTILEPLPPEAWLRQAKVTGAGKPLIRSVYTYAESLVVHERPHLKQIQRIVTLVKGIA